MLPLASYFLENFELIALSGLQRRPCYQVLQKLFILQSVCRRQVSPLCGICSLALPSLCVCCRRLGGQEVDFLSVRGEGICHLFFAHGCVRRFVGRTTRGV